MRFIDETKLKVAAGNGGNGIVSFRREAHVSRGGPDGGDGGRGGNVIFHGEPGINTLLNIHLLRHIKAEDGKNGMTKNAYGRKGKDYILKVPLGTLVYENDRLLCDIKEEKDYIIAKGGKGGKGNTKFKSSKNTAPRISENGDPGESFDLRLELQVLADVGFVGMPSAGKSQMLSVISNAKPKVASYPFTTINPKLGLVKVKNNSFVVADLPGLIKGAAQGKGLGHEFLRHINRSKVIAHIIDMGSPDKDPINDYKQIREELISYSPKLGKRATVIIANKKDLKDFMTNLKEFKKKFPNLKIVETSGITKEGIEEMKALLYKTLKGASDIIIETKETEKTITLKDDVIVTKEHEGLYEVSGIQVKRIYDKIPLSTDANFNRFNKLMKDIGVWSKLRELGVKDGDFVRIYEYEFEWSEEE